jgi:AraC family transcriptional regulator of adaptative response / DNA-3-methyladenine glycosylase II
MRADVLARAMRLIADGVVDREGVPGLAGRLGYSTRHLERLLLAEVGAGPIAIARAQRAQSARVLIETTPLAMGEIAFAAGFASVRQFNDTVREVFDIAPSELRRRSEARHGSGATHSLSEEEPARSPRRNDRTGSSVPQTIRLRLPFREPLWPDNLFGHLAATAVAGCEEVRSGAYRRTIGLAHGPGIVSLRPAPDHIVCELTLTDLRDLTTVITRCRRLLDLDADPVAAAELLSEDPLLAPIVEKSAGQRIPRTVDECELATRIVIGQQVSTVSAQRQAARLVSELGTPIEDPHGGLTHLFPTAPQLLAADPAMYRMPASRKTTLQSLAGAIDTGTIDLGPGADRAEARRRLSEIAGIGPWSIELIAMRAMGDPDAFPFNDLGVRRAAASVGLPGGQKALLEHARAWSPWRSYAVQYLWSVLDHPINTFAG